MSDSSAPAEHDDGRAGPRRGGKRRDGETGRLCIVRREVLPTGRMIRFVAGPQGDIVPDLAHKLPGRGVWVDGHRDLVMSAVKKGHFQRSLKRAVAIDPGLVDTVERLLVADARQALSLANKAGLVVHGFGKVDAAVGAGRAEILIRAQEARPDGAGKLLRKFLAVQRDRGTADPPVIDDLTAADLSLAIGEENVIHAAAASGGQSHNFLRRVLRLRRYRTASTDESVVRAQGPARPAGSGAELTGMEEV